MSTSSRPDDILASALRLPIGERARITNALQESLVDDTIDHGPADPADEVESAWSEETARRIADIESGRVKSIPADEAERMIRGHGQA
jgi:hypothetical protein